MPPKRHASLLSPQELGRFQYWKYGNLERASHPKGRLSMRMNSTRKLRRKIKRIKSARSLGKDPLGRRKSQTSQLAALFSQIEASREVKEHYQIEELSAEY